MTDTPDVPPDHAPWETLHILATSVTEATRKVEEDRRVNEQRIAASVEKMRWFRRAALLAVAASALSGWAAVRANNAVDQIRAQRTQSRIVACEKDNDTATKVNKLNDRNQQLLRNVFEGGAATRTAEQNARASAFVASELAEYQKIKVPLRDCSSAAVERFYSKP